MLFLGILNNVIMNNIKDGWRSLLMLLCEPIYKLISYTYDLFEVVGTADLLTSETITTIFNRISLLLGIFMLFKLVLSFVQMLINPDNITDKEKGVGNLTKKAILVVILLGITPTIFSKAMELQNFIVGVNGEKNVIAKIILPSGDESQFEDFGAELSAYLFTAFYTYDSDFNEQRRLGNIDDNKLCNLIEDSHKQNGQTFLYRSIKNNKGDISVAYNCLDEDFTYEDEISDEEVKKYTISFSSSGIFAVVVGIVILWMLISYTIAVGVRVVQLVFLRVISPLAIMGYLSPKKDGMFEKWLKMCTSTYIDLFIRMAIIYFIIYIISLLIGDTGLGLAIYKDFDPEQMWIINVVIIIALLIFAKKAPELLKELFPKGGAGSIGYGFKSPKKMLDDMLGGKQLWNATKRTAGFGLGAVTGGAIGFLGGRGAGRVSGLFGGMGRGAFNGAKKGGLWSNLKGVSTKQAQINKQKIEWRNNGSTWGGRMSQRMANAFGAVGIAEGFENQMAEYDKELNALNAKSSAYKEASGSVGKMEDRATSQLDTKTFKPGQIYQRNLQQRRRNYKAISEAMSNGDIAAAKNIAINELTRARDERDEKLNEYKQKFNNGEISKEEYAACVAYVSSAFKKSQQTIMAMNVGTYNAAQASADMTDVFTETRNEYITQSLKDENGDVVIRSEYDHIQDVVNHADNKEAFAKFKNSSVGNTYKAMDDFASEAKGANTALSSDIYRAQTAKDTIAKSEAKKAADADRSAVGGHSGGKK